MPLSFQLLVDFKKKKKSKVAGPLVFIRDHLFIHGGQQARTSPFLLHFVFGTIQSVT